MALTLTEGNKYSRTELQKAVIDLLVKDSPILQKLPFKSIIGNSLTYDMWTTAPTAAFYSVGDTWTESTPVITQDTAALTILGGDADVDNFIKATRSNIIDVTSEVLAQKVQAVQYKYLDTFYYGTGTAPEFKGLHGLINSTTYNTVENASGGSAAQGSIKELRQTIDLITGSVPSMIVSSKAVRRDVSAYLDSVGAAFQADRVDFGKHILTFDGIPWMVDDNIVNTEAYSGTSYSAKTGGTTASTVFILSFSPTACCGVQGDKGVETIKLGDLETKDASRIRIRWYCGLMFQDLRSCAKYSGITTGTTWAA